MAALSANYYISPLLLTELWRRPPAYRRALPPGAGPHCPLPLLDAPTGGSAGGGELLRSCP